MTEADYERLLDEAREILVQIERFPARDLLAHAKMHGTESERDIASRIWAGQLESA